MAEYVTIRHPRTLEEKRITQATTRFFPDWSVVVADEPPAKNASTDVWRAFATKNGFATEEAAAAMGRDELIALAPTTTTTEEN